MYCYCIIWHRLYNLLTAKVKMEAYIHWKGFNSSELPTLSPHNSLTDKIAVSQIVDWSTHDSATHKLGHLSAGQLAEIFTQNVTEIG